MPALMQQNFSKPEETRPFDPPSSGHLDLVAGGKVGLAEFTPGWRWSDNVRPIVGGTSCQQGHVGYFITGSMVVRADDGTEITYGPGDYAEMEPGHDAWVPADQQGPTVVLDWGAQVEGMTGFSTYAKPPG
jgi:hypothetical protein